MKYTVDLNDRPVYLQIYRQLRADIVGGRSLTAANCRQAAAEELRVSTTTERI